MSLKGQTTRCLGFASPFSKLYSLVKTKCCTIPGSVQLVLNGSIFFTGQKGVIRLIRWVKSADFGVKTDRAARQNPSGNRFLAPSLLPNPCQRQGGKAGSWNWTDCAWNVWKHGKAGTLPCVATIPFVLCLSNAFLQISSKATDNVSSCRYKFPIHVCMFKFPQPKKT